MRRATPSSSARSHSRWGETSTPMTALITNTADSQTRSAPRASATKDGSPGVSMRLTLAPCQSKEARLALMDMPRDFSSSSESETVVPSATEPSRDVAPASKRRASISDVFPLPRWPTKATLRILSAAACGIANGSSRLAGPGSGAGGVPQFAGPYSSASRARHHSTDRDGLDGGGDAAHPDEDGDDDEDEAGDAEDDAG